MVIVNTDFALYYCGIYSVVLMFEPQVLFILYISKQGNFSGFYIPAL